MTCEQQLDMTNNKQTNKQKIVPNSCATHALLSILLNCDKSASLRRHFHLGEMLDKFKRTCDGLAPDVNISSHFNIRYK